MQTRAKVMHGMITIIPASVVIDSIDAIDGTGEIILRIFLVDEGMLRPVSKHHHDSCKHKRNDEYPKCCLQIHETHSYAKKVKRHLAISESHIKFLALAIRSEEHTSELQSRENLVC